MRLPVKKPKATPMPHGWLNWLRALAATEVLIWHSDLVTKGFSQSTVMTGFYRHIGAVGVEVFFLLSAYLMCMRAPTYRSGASFMAIRLARIAPLYWIFTSLVVLAYLLNSRWHLGGFSLSVPEILTSYLMLPSAGFPILSVGWTLEYEMIFYALVAVLAAGSSPGKSREAVLVALVALGLCSFLLPESLVGGGGARATALGHAFSPYMLIFASGWLARLVEERREALLHPVLLAWSLALACLYQVLGHADAVQLGARTGAAVLCFLLLRMMREWCEGDGLVHRLGRLLGAASFSIYLSHWLVLSAFGKVLQAMSPPELAAWPLRVAGIAAALGLGLAIYVALEQPLDRILRGRLSRPGTSSVKLLDADPAPNRP